MPKIATVFLLTSPSTTAMQSCNAFVNASAFWIVWSAGVITKIGSLSKLSLASWAHRAAKERAGAVFRPVGSSNKAALILSISRSWSSTKNRWSSLVTISVGSRVIHSECKLFRRATASWNRLLFNWLPDKGKNCFGNPERDRGQSRVPEPPHKITGVILLMVLSFNALLWPYWI